MSQPQQQQNVYGLYSLEEWKKLQKIKKEQTIQSQINSKEDANEVKKIRKS